MRRRARAGQTSPSWSISPREETAVCGLRARAVASLEAGVDDAGDDEGDGEIAEPAGGAGDEGVESEASEGSEGGGDVSVGEAALAVEGVVGCDEGFALESSADESDDRIGQVGEVAEGLVFDLPVFAEGSAQEVGSVGLALVVSLCCGYVDGVFSRRHTSYALGHSDSCQVILVATYYIPKHP